MQHARGFIVICANGWLWSPGRQSTPNSKLGKLYMQHITYGLQGDRLHVCKAVLLVQTSRATCLQSNPIGTNFAGFCSNLKQFYWYKWRGLLFKLRRPWASQLSRGLFTGCTLIGRLQVTRWGRGSPPFHGKPKPKSWPPAGPGPLPAPAPAAPHNKTYFSAPKTNKKNIRHMNYRHW